MGAKDSKPVRTPFEQQQQQTNTFGLTPSISRTPEARDFLGLPLDFGDYSGLQTDVDIDPGIGRRTQDAEAEAINRAESAFSGGTPRYIREANLAKEQREIRGRGAAERQQAEYLRGTAQRGLEFQKAGLMGNAASARTLADLDRRRMLLPQVVQTGGSGSSSGFNTQLTQPKPGLGSSILGGAATLGAAAIPFI